jgi:ribosomal protein S12 methylthiotransferase accessory factor
MARVGSERRSHGNSLERALGVTRVARVTGLDRADVEVACAIRPGGHVLQVTNGKGDTWAQARASAVSEAAELWAAERVDPRELVYGSARELRVAPEWLPRDLAAPRLFTPDTRIAWRRGRDLRTGREVLVPAQAIHCPPRGSPPLGPAAIRWSTNGMGAHPSRDLALRHALFEAAERDLLARALPHGWTPHAIRTRKLDATRMPLWRKLRDVRLEAHLFDLEGAVAGAILFDLDDGPIPVTAGYCCAETLEEAAHRALLEAVQSRLTEVHGAREDVLHAERSQSGLREACQRARPTRTLHRRRTRLDLPRHVAIVELAREPLHVVKVYAPELRVSELL